MAHGKWIGSAGTAKKKQRNRSCQKFYSWHIVSHGRNTAGALLSTRSDSSCYIQGIGVRNTFLLSNRQKGRATHGIRIPHSCFRRTLALYSWAMCSSTEHLGIPGGCLNHNQNILPCQSTSYRETSACRDGWRVWWHYSKKEMEKNNSPVYPLRNLNGNCAFVILFRENSKKMDLLGIEPRTFPTLCVLDEKTNNAKGKLYH